MKKVALISFLFLFSNLSFAQQFNLDSSELKVGDVYISQPKIIFDLAKWNIRPQSYEQLNRIAEFIKNHEGLVLEIGVHMDSRGSDHYSTCLDKKRAESVQNYLVQKGIAPERLTAQGYGETQLLISDQDIAKMKTAKEKEEAHALNRRTEFKILEIKE